MRQRNQAARITRVQVLIREGRLPAQKLGRSDVIDEGDLSMVKDRKPGRPPKAKAEADSKVRMKRVVRSDLHRLARPGMKER
jgi:hypothetical protein